jgi:3-hydroxybutyryl-CoA dehydrogenase
MSFSTVFIPGAGFMGSAIAFLIAAKTDATVTLFDIYPASLEKAQKTIDKYAKSSIEKGFLTTERFDDLQRRMRYSDSFKDATGADLVIEAIAEDVKTKQEMFRNLDHTCKPQAIFASNTSSLSITALASVTKRADRFIGMHFFSPAHVMKLLELIPGLDTSAETFNAIKSYGEQLGKTVISAKDMPGFITTRLGLVLVNEAAFALMEGLGTAHDIDTGMTLGYNHPMGPLALADFIGLDIALHILETLYEGFGDPKYRACPLIRQLVAAGHLGRKTGRGFYDYSDSAKPAAQAATSGKR